MQVLKFGGTSVGSSKALEQVLSIVQERNETTRLCVVVSALGGVTNELDAAIADAALGGHDWQAKVEKLRRRHAEMITTYLNTAEQSWLNGLLDRICFRLIQQLSGIKLLREASAKTRDAVLTSGEYLSSELLAGALRSCGQAATVFNPVELIRTNSEHGKASVDLIESSRRIRNLLNELPAKTVAVIAGFTGQAATGEVTTLGRGGSDYSAAVIASALSAERLEIWTDVDGVMNADPQISHSAEKIRELSYRDAENLSLLGAKVLHPQTIAPLVKQNIPLQVRNTFRPQEPGTRISGYVNDLQQLDVITSQSGLSLLSLHGIENEEFPGLLATVYVLFERVAISILHCETDRTSATLRLLLHSEEAAIARQHIEREIVARRPELELLTIEKTDHLSRVSIFSNRLPFRHAGSVLVLLNEKHIEPLQVIQSNLHTLSLVVSEALSAELVRLLHDALFNPKEDEAATNGAICTRSAG